jgi:ADP-ribose pyrophosphatase
MKEKFVRNIFAYQGRAIGFRSDGILLPNGKSATRDYLHHPGAVAVIPFLDSPKKKPLLDCRVVLVRQYRYPVYQITDEIPAGKLDRNESIPKCLVRELKEETGYTTAKFHLLLSYWPTPAVSTELIHIYWCDGLKKGKSNPDEDEFLSVKTETFGRMLRKIRKGRIKDSKTVIAFTAFAAFWNVERKTL